MKTSIKILLFILVSLSLSSCRHDMSDLDRFFQETNARPPKPIPALPEINSPEVFVYEAEELRDPFSNDLQEVAVDITGGKDNTKGPGPDLTRRKEYLESFPIDSLIMVGTYLQEGNFWGLVQDPEGVIHRTSLGEHLGQNHGEIVAISEDQIDVSEWVSDGLDGWIKREASIALRDEE